MPDPKNFALHYRPSSYWGPETLEQHFGSRISGEVRRRAVLDDLAAGNEPPAEVLASKLDESNRQALGAVHPRMMGGEYLPDFSEGEVEIARAVLDSTTMDVISLRARRTRTRILYRIADEYEGASAYPAHPRTSRNPLTLKQLIHMIDSAYEGGLDGCFRESNYEEGDSDPADLAHFCKISSTFYRGLSTWYDTKNDEWLAEEQAKLAKEWAEAEL